MEIKIKGGLYICRNDIFDGCCCYAILKVNAMGRLIILYFWYVTNGIILNGPR